MSLSYLNPAMEALTNIQTDEAKIFNDIFGWLNINAEQPDPPPPPGPTPPPPVH